MKKYELYKDSGIKAIGNVPEHWVVTLIKNTLEIPITDGPHITPELHDEGIPFISAESIKNGKIDFEKRRGNISKKDYEFFSKKYIPQRNDIYMVKSGATTGNVAMVETDITFTIWSPLAVFRAKQDKLDAKYLHFYLQSNNFKSLVEINWSYGTQQNIGMGVLSNLSITYPSLPEQTTIASFLDYKTAQIDVLIEKKEQLIEKLKSQRQAIINEAVTKGLNSNVKMKDSGIEWLGEIPEHWNFNKAKRNTYMKGRIGWQGLKQEEFIDEGPYLITGMNFKDGIIRWDEVYHISKERYDQAPEIQLKDGDVLMTKDGTIGKLLFVDYLPGPASLNSHLLVLRCTDGTYLQKFLYYQLMSLLFLDHIELHKTGTTFYGITQESVGKYQMLLPPLNEQKEIINFIEDKLLNIAKLSELLSLQIQKFIDYRQSLISEAVTGKIDVRDWEDKN